MLESDAYYGRHSRAKKSAGFTCTHIGNHALNGTDINAPCCEEPREALHKIGLQLVDKYPKVSPDLNAIENAWKHLRDRLDETFPPNLETREEFIRRLHNAVHWLNRNKGELLLTLSRNQKLRAQDVRKKKGGRAQW